MLVFVLFFLGGCNQNNQNPGYDQGPPELPVAIVERGDALVTKEYSASIEGVANVEIRPQVTGYLEKILVDEGAYVKAGQALFLVESSIYREQYNTAQANLTTATIELNRKKELVKSKIVSELQVEQADAAYRAAAAQAATARINLNFCTIKAPVSGYIGCIAYRLGSLMSPSNAAPITLLSDIHEVNAYFSMSENDFHNLQQQYPQKNLSEYKLPVELLISNGSKYEFPGKIDAVEGQFNENTGSITLRAKFNNPKSALRSGNTGKIRIEEKYKDAVLLPIASTIFIQDKTFVFLLDKEGKAQQVPIEITGKSEKNYIISNGLKPGDKYIVSGFERLQPGTKVVEQKAPKQ